MRRNGSQTSRRKPRIDVGRARVGRAQADGEQELDDDVEDDQERVDVDERREVVGDVGAGGGEDEQSSVTARPEHGVEGVAEGGAQTGSLERVEAARR